MDWQVKKEKKAKELIKKIKVIYANPQKPLLIFEIPGKGTVIKNKKGWICDVQESNESYVKKVERHIKQKKPIPTRWSCSFRDDQECYHVLACKKVAEIFRL